MEIVSKGPEPIEIHVKVTRQELHQIVTDIDADCTASNPCIATEEFCEYLRSLYR